MYVRHHSQHFSVTLSDCTNMHVVEDAGRRSVWIAFEGVGTNCESALHSSSGYTSLLENGLATRL